MKFAFNVKKLLTPSTIGYLAVALLSLVSLIIYGANVGAEGFYHNRPVAGVVGLSILCLVLALVAVASTFVEAEGVSETVIRVVLAIIKIVVPCLLLLLAVKIAGERADGLGYIYFSNEDVKKEVATPANLASAATAITSIVFFAVSGIAGIVASFLPEGK